MSLDFDTCNLGIVGRPKTKISFPYSYEPLPKIFKIFHLILEFLEITMSQSYDTWEALEKLQS